MGRFAELLEARTPVQKKLPRDGDGDGIIFEGTPQERPLRPGDKVLEDGATRIVESITGPRLRLKDPETGEKKRVRVGSPKLDPHPAAAPPASPTIARAVRSAVAQVPPTRPAPRRSAPAPVAPSPSTPRLTRQDLPNPSLQNEAWVRRNAEIFNNDSFVRQTLGGDVDEPSPVAVAAERAGLPVEEFKARETAYIKKWTDPVTTKVVSRVTQRVLSSILGSGRFKTQHENNRSNGMLAPDTRRRTEEEMWGIPQDSPVELRPVYGYISDADETVYSDGALLQYGDVIVEMKPELRERTTITGDDSLTASHRLGSLLPMLIDEADWRVSHLGAGYGPRPVSSHGQPSQSGSFIEAQIHGGVSTEDIKHVTFANEPTTALTRKLDRAGIPWTFKDETAIRATASWTHDEKLYTREAERLEKRVAELEAGVELADHEKRRWDRERREQVDATREWHIEELSRIAEGHRKRVAEAVEKRLEYEALLARGELRGFIDVKAMANKKLRFWLIELRLRRIAGEKVEHLIHEAAEDAEQRGPRSREGAGVAWPGESRTGKHAWAADTRAIAASLQNEGLQLPPYEELRMKADLYLRD